jgi:hypothetical protein
MMESAVQLLHLVQSMKGTVTVTLNAKDTLPVGQTIVLPLFHLMQIAVIPLLFHTSSPKMAPWPWQKVPMSGPPQIGAMNSRLNMM